MKKFILGIFSMVLVTMSLIPAVQAQSPAAPAETPVIQNEAPAAEQLTPAATTETPTVTEAPEVAPLVAVTEAESASTWTDGFTDSFTNWPGEFHYKGGVMISLLNIPLIGISGMTGYQAEAPTLTGMIKDYLDYDLKIEHETTVYIHLLAGSASKTHLGDSGTVNVSWQSIELDYFLLADIGDGWKLGPGIGYGIGTSKESAPYASLSTFLDADDIHYGVLLLKGQKTFGEYDCEITLNSFGGLISGAFLCGQTF